MLLCLIWALSGLVSLGATRAEQAGPAAELPSVPARRAVPAGAVSIPDDNLRAALEQALGMEPGEAISSAAMAALSGSLELHGRSIVNLTGLEHATGIEFLFLGSNAIVDVAPLGALSNLYVLDLRANNISDVASLAGLSSLQVLYLGSNDFEGIPVLAGMPNLSSLSFFNSKISDVSPLANLSTLRFLDLDSNDISDVSSLRGLRNLKWLFLSSNDISDVTTIPQLPDLQALNLANNRIADVSQLPRPASLRELDLSGNSVSDVSALSQMYSVRILDLGGNAISEAAPLARMTGLTRLSLAGNPVADVASLGSLLRLTGLDLSGTDVSDISSLGQLRNLQELRLGNNFITDVSALARLSELTDLDLSGNLIRDPSPLLQNVGLGDGDSLDISSNPANDGSVYRALERRGVQVDSGFMIADIAPDDFPDSYLTRVYNDNVLVMYLTEDLRTSFNTHPTEAFSRDVYKWFADTFDYLLFLSNLDSISDNEEPVPYGRYDPVMNETEGIGMGRFYNRAYGSAGKLRGVIRFPYNDALLGGPSLHELQHAWANHALPTAVPGHWGFSSADGQLGGFARAALTDHGNGQYSAGDFGTFANWGNSVPYSPIELYFAGLVSAEEVPDIWVAVDGRWVETDDDSQRFTARNVRQYTIEEVVERLGERVPGVSESPRHFRAAVILLTDKDHPATESQLQLLSEAVAIFSKPSAHESYRYNYYEATGGRGSIAMDGLSALRKQASGLPARPPSLGALPAPHFCWPAGPDSRTGVSGVADRASDFPGGPGLRTPSSNPVGKRGGAAWHR